MNQSLRRLIKDLTSVPPQTHDKNFLKDCLYGSSKELTQRIKTHKEIGVRKDFHNWVLSKLRPEGKLMLDAGCGTGNLLIPIAELINKMRVSGFVIGVDISPTLVAQLDACLARFKLPARAVVGDIERLNFPDNTFDQVLCAYVLYHCPNISKAINELRRVVKKDGRVFVMTNSCNTMKKFEEINSKALSLTLSTKVPLASRIETRFCSENAPEFFDGCFRVVRRSCFKDVLEFATVDEFINFYNNSRGRNKHYLTARQCGLLQKNLRNVTSEIISSNGSIRVAKRSHLFCLAPL